MTSGMLLTSAKIKNRRVDSKLNKTQALVDDAEDLTFKDALDKTIEKEKRLIYQAFANAKEEKCESSNNNNGGDEDTTNVWCLMLQEIEEDNFDVLEAFKIYMLHYHSVKHDKVFQAIMKTLEIAIGVDTNFEEALDWTVQNNKSLITWALAKARNEDVQRLGKENWTQVTTQQYQQPALLYT